MQEYLDYESNEIVTIYSRFEPKEVDGEIVDCIVEFKLGCSEYRRFDKLKVMMRLSFI